MTAKAVVGAELQNEHCERLAQHPIQPAQAARARLSGNAGVHRPERQACRIGQFRKAGDVAIVVAE